MGGVWPQVVVEGDPAPDAGLGLRAGFPGVQTDAFILQRPPEAVNEDVVEVSGLPEAAISTSCRCLEMSPLAHASIRCRAADVYQNTGIRSMLNLGHGRSPLWCDSQNHHRDPRPGYGRLLRNFGGCAGGHNLQQRSFPTCYGPEYISGKLLIWAEERGIVIQHIQPGQPQQNAYIERYNRTVRHEWLGNTSSKPSRRPKITQRNGSGLTTTTARTWESAASHPPRN